MVSTAAGAPEGRKILVADDQIHVLERVRTSLEREGYQVITAHNGEEALERVKEQRPNLILCDVMMPRKDGFEMRRALQADPMLADIPFVMLMGRPACSDFTGYRGGPPHLTKPFKTEDLLRTIDAMFASRHPFDEGGNGRLATGETVTASWKGTFVPAPTETRWERFRRWLTGEGRA